MDAFGSIASMRLLPTIFSIVLHLAGAQSSRKSSISTAAPEVKVTKPIDKDRAAENEGGANIEAKPKSLLSLLPVRLDFYII